MEFASEMIIKAALKGEQIAEVPVSLSRDLRDRPPHLRPWRDGWRHLRYLLMLSPTWVFAVPATFAGALSLAIWTYAAVATSLGASATSPIGNQWIILAGAMIGLRRRRASRSWSSTAAPRPRPSILREAIRIVSICAPWNVATF
jgi:hypothetical protein